MVVLTILKGLDQNDWELGSIRRTGVATKGNAIGQLAPRAQRAISSMMSSGASLHVSNSLRQPAIAVAGGRLVEIERLPIGIEHDPQAEIKDASAHQRVPTKG
jgi:hypothetical protein